MTCNLEGTIRSFISIRKDKIIQDRQCSYNNEHNHGTQSQGPTRKPKCYNACIGKVNIYCGHIPEFTVACIFVNIERYIG